MHFPRFWARGESALVTPVNPQTGEPRPLRCWGWSDVSLAEARELGQRRAARLASRLLAGEKPERYGYDTPFREEVLEEWREPVGAGAEPWAVVSRNAYGCRVLNTRNILFADLDAPSPDFSWKTMLLYLLGRGAKVRLQNEERRRRWELEAGKRIEEILLARGASVRVYRTFGGIRCLLTSEQAEPDDDGTIEILRDLGSDPLYVRLCLARGCFRARLTPKPWRCGLPALDVEYPWETDEARADMKSWVVRYRDVCGGYATCDLVAALGSGATDERIARVIAYHDRETGVGSGRPLA